MLYAIGAGGWVWPKTDVASRPSADDVLAQRVPDTKLVGDAARLEVHGRPDLKQYMQRAYRPGWEMKVQLIGPQH